MGERVLVEAEYTQNTVLSRGGLKDGRWETVMRGVMGEGGRCRSLATRPEY